MQIESIFRPLADLERALADLYDHFAQVFSADQELAFFFFKMAAEERGHASLVDYQKRIVQRSNVASIDADLDVRVIADTLERVKALRAAAEPPSPDEAIRETMRLEANAAESHYRNALRQVDPGVARLLDALGGEDRRHVERIQAMAERRGIALPAAG